MKDLIFPVALSIHLIQLEKKTLKWLENVHLLKKKNDIAEIREQKIIRFAAYLFPEMEINRLEIVMRFFCCLFLLDDRLDHITPEEGLDWINCLCDEKTERRFNPLIFEILKLNREMLRLSDKKKWRKGWIENWDFHLEGLLWELDNRCKRSTPDLRDYQIQRPFASGVFLALHLLRMEFFENSLIVQKLEWDVSRLIVLSNDLSSSEKEKSMGDFQNELLLLEVFIGSSQAKNRVENEIIRLHSQIIQVAERIRLEYPKMEKWLESIMLLLGGCHYWSEITARYFAKINGEMKR